MSLFSRFVASDVPEFHSSGIAKADEQQAQTIGSADHSSFNQRKSVENNRQMVRGYHTSGVVGVYRQEAKLSASPVRPVVKHVSRSKSAGASRGTKPLSVAQPRDSHTQPTPSPTHIQRPSFAEPSSRRFNPFT